MCRTCVTHVTRISHVCYTPVTRVFVKLPLLGTKALSLKDLLGTNATWWQ